MIYTNTLVEVKVGKSKLFYKEGEEGEMSEDISDWTMREREEFISDLTLVAKASSELNGAHYFVLDYEKWLDCRSMIF